LSSSDFGRERRAAKEAWIADSGGFVVKYVRSANGTDIYFG